MTRQSERALEDGLVQQLEGLGYAFVPIRNEQDFLANLKVQLEVHNGLSLTAEEFKSVLNHLNKGSVFDRAKILRDRMPLSRADGTLVYITFLNQEKWCQNQFQVTRQVSVKGIYKNRYDVTLLVNGLPLAHIELKRRGLELKEAFNQIRRYQGQSFGASEGLYNYVQLFVISDGVNTKYYANNKQQSFKQTFYWSDEANRKITQLKDFTDDFLTPCHLAKVICKYTVLAEATKTLMVLRPYQYYAVERLIDRVKNTRKNGYIWHTTGSGKTLTSFKASQLLIDLPQVHKVVFVVDRKDLDYQTTREFNSFSDGSVDGTQDTKSLVRRFSDDTKLIVTTIQKLNKAIGGGHYATAMKPLRSKRVVFIFDECHRSQFGKAHARIKGFFQDHQLFGFTGTPIFVDNAVRDQSGMRTTTKALFGDCLHKYVIVDAIRDENILKFSIEYISIYREKQSIDTQALLESKERLEKITDYIIQNHRRKTYDKTFTALFCVSSVKTLIRYYALFQAKKNQGQHDLKIATIFSYTANEADQDAEDCFPNPAQVLPVAAESETSYQTPYARDKLDAFMADYNQIFHTRYSTRDNQSYYAYYNDIARRVKHREVDILLVVNMFLTGFDSKWLNTLYVDKNLRYHSLIQAFSRTNRILNARKSHGNIVAFRNLKAATDEAIALFSNQEAKGDILTRPYEHHLEDFARAYDRLTALTPSPQDIDALQTEEEELRFVKSFRDLMRIKNKLTTFSNFSYADLPITEQEFEDFKSKYLDIYDKVKGQRSTVTQVSVLDDIDFEVLLIHRDEINVEYILQLLSALAGADAAGVEQKREQISRLLSGQPQLRSKKALIQQFIEENLIRLTDPAFQVQDAFEVFWDRQREKAFQDLCAEENLRESSIQQIMEEYLFSNRIIGFRDKLRKALLKKEKLLKEVKTIERVMDKINKFMDTFLKDIAA